MTVVDLFVPLWPIPILGAVGLREGWKWGLPTVAIRKVQIPDMTEEVVKRGNPADAMGVLPARYFEGSVQESVVRIAGYGRAGPCTIGPES